MQILRGLMTVASAGIVATLMTASPASANILTSSSPAAGAVLAVAPNAISVTGNSPLSEQGSTLSVTDPTGLQVDDGSLTINESTAVIGLKPLTAAGVYTVTYNLVSATDAPLMGSYTFLFNAPAAISSPTPTPTPAQSSAAPSTKVNHTVDIFVIILMVAAVFVGLFLLWYARMLIREQQENKRRSRSRSKKVSRPARTKNEDED